MEVDPKDVVERFDRDLSKWFSAYESDVVYDAIDAHVTNDLREFFVRRPVRKIESIEIAGEAFRPVSCDAARTARR